MREVGAAGVLEWPLIGRDEELASAAAIVAEAGAGGLLIAGDPGVGKTRLVAEIVAADASGWEWQVIRASPGTGTVGFGAFMHHLDSTSAVASSVASVWLGLRTALGISAGAGVGLVVEDAHWLDELSAAFVHHVASTGQAKLLVTTRRQEHVPDAITALWKDQLLARLDLQPLSDTDVTRLVELALGAPIEPMTARKVIAATRGNALFLRELIQGAVASGDLRLIDGAWIASGPMRAPPRLIELLAGRLARLSADERRALELVSIAGGLPVPTAARLAGDEVLQSLERQGLLAIDDEARPGHPLFADVVVAEMPTLTRRARVTDLIDALQPPPAALAVRIATWRVEHGIAGPVELLIDAAQKAVEVCAFGDAERLARAAVEGRAPGRGGLCLGEALLGQGRHADADQVLGAMAIDELPSADRVRWAMLRALAIGTVLGRPQEAVGIVEATLAVTPPGTPRNGLEAFLAQLLVELGRLREGLAHALPHVEGLGDEVATLWAVLPAVSGLSLTGHPLDALAVCDRVLPVAVRHLTDQPVGMIGVMAGRTIALGAAGRYTEAEPVFLLLEQAALQLQDQSVLGAITTAHGVYHANIGTLRTALPLFRRGAALNRLDNRRGILAMGLATMAQALAQLGEAGEATIALADAEAAMWVSHLMVDMEVDAARAWVAAVMGDIDAACAQFRSLAEDMAGRGAFGLEARFRHEAIRVGASPATHADRLGELAMTIQGDRAPAYALHAGGLRDADPVRVMEAAHLFAGSGSPLLAAEAYVGAAGLFEDRALPARAAEAQRAAMLELAKCEEPRTPLLGADRPRRSLTRRELEIAIQASHDRTSTEIAAALGISTRTVETHLQRAYDKLGVNRRGDLRVVLDAYG